MVQLPDRKRLGARRLIVIALAVTGLLLTSTNVLSLA